MREALVAARCEQNDKKLNYERKDGTQESAFQNHYSKKNAQQDHICLNNLVYKILEIFWRLAVSWQGFTEQ